KIPHALVRGFINYKNFMLLLYESSTFTSTPLRPHLLASLSVWYNTSMRFPCISPPVSPAIASPSPSTHTFQPSGITLASTAITFGPSDKSIPVADTPEQPAHA